MAIFNTTMLVLAWVALFWHYVRIDRTDDNQKVLEERVNKLEKSSRR